MGDKEGSEKRGRVAQISHKTDFLGKLFSNADYSQDNAFAALFYQTYNFISNKVMRSIFFLIQGTGVFDIYVGMAI